MNARRRQWLKQATRWSLGGLALAGGGLPLAALAGAQKEEHLADSVRTALSAAVQASAPPAPVFGDRKSEMEYQAWLAAMKRRLGARMIDDFTRHEFLQTVWYESARAGLEVSLVLGLIQVESNFRKFAISAVGARGLMQVMPFWARVIGDGDASKLFHQQTNLRFGCVILRYYLQRENGNLFYALGRYNGSRGQAKYPNAVLGAQRNWLL
ncbi:lytic transglycosylase domain-containing protein [Brachymonas denitrificans]|uniref:lytic transglycosylase domain-containing protein n=1 Tax=Brachymonas denitrificans TaxID=28220 RepID=UPI001BCEDE1A|nr:transglycosylase SLT domain-containing protein [Brachymonas denitrificans]